MAASIAPATPVFCNTTNVLETNEAELVPLTIPEDVAFTAPPLVIWIGECTPSLKYRSVPSYKLVSA